MCANILGNLKDLHCNSFLKMQIGNLEGYYHFQLNVSYYRGQNPDAGNVTHLASRSIGSLSRMNKSPSVGAALSQHDGVRLLTVPNS